MERGQTRFPTLRFGAFAVRQRFRLRIYGHGTELGGRGFPRDPASCPGLVSTVTEDDHGGTRQVDNREDCEVNKVNQELWGKRKKKSIDSQSDKTLITVT